MNEEYKKIGNTSFRVEAIKKMALKDFKSTYKGLGSDSDLEEKYEAITGKSVKAKSVKGSDEENE